jgi:hypothetical protein
MSIDSEFEFYSPSTARKGDLLPALARLLRVVANAPDPGSLLAGAFVYKPEFAGLRQEFAEIYALVESNPTDRAALVARIGEWVRSLHETARNFLAVRLDRPELATADNVSLLALVRAG